MATVRAVGRRLAARSDADGVEILSFHADVCAEAARLGHRAGLVAWTDCASSALAAWARRVGVGGVCVEHFLLHQGLVDELHAGGLSVTTGTVNDIELAGRVARLGVEAIATDRPAGLLHDARGTAHASAQSTAMILG